MFHMVMPRHKLGEALHALHNSIVLALFAPTVWQSYDKNNFDRFFL